MFKMPPKYGGRELTHDFFFQFHFLFILFYLCFIFLFLLFSFHFTSIFFHFISFRFLKRNQIKTKSNDNHVAES